MTFFTLEGITLEGKVQKEQRELPPTQNNYEVGQTVPILEHPNCAGLRGVVQADGAILCIKCNRSAYADNQEFQRESSTHRS